jgi:hypothetical protein
MKPNLSNKIFIEKVIHRDLTNLKILKKNENIVFFNFLFILLIILFILFLIFRYIEKKKNNDIIYNE